MSAAIDEVLIRRLPIDLATVRADADLQQRYDAKYVVLADTAADLLASLDSHWHVLEVDGKRSTAYSSAYFDDEHFGLFRDHIKGRRLRYKVRTRRYGNDSSEMLEIKLKSGRGATDKRRKPRAGSVGVDLTSGERQWLSETVLDAYGRPVAASLGLTLALGYTRRTLFNASTGERVTVDSDLVATAGAMSAAPVGQAVVIEVKSVDWHGPTVRMLQQHSVRPLTFSKYCAALASLYPELDQRAGQRARRSVAQYQT